MTEPVPNNAAAVIIIITHPNAVASSDGQHGPFNVAQAQEFLKTLDR